MRYLFLSYVSRSGSTLLARMLADAAPELLALPENGLVDLLLAKGDERLREMSADELERLFRLDGQLSNLELTASDLAAIARAGIGQGARAILDSVVAHFAASRDVVYRHILLKKGSYLRNRDALRSLDPSAAFVHIFRDGRAAASSMLKADRPRFRGERMLGGDPRRMAHRWRQTMQLADSCRGTSEPTLHEVRYEELVARPREVVEDLLRELGVTLGEDTQEPRSAVVGAEERALHLLVDRAPRPERALAWREELSLHDGVAFELVAGDELVRRGYPLWFLKRVGRVRRVTIDLVSRGTSLARAAVYYWRRLTFYARRPAKLRLRMKKRRM